MRTKANKQVSLSDTENVLAVVVVSTSSEHMRTPGNAELLKVRDDRAYIVLGLGYVHDRIRYGQATTPFNVHADCLSILNLIVHVIQTLVSVEILS